MYVFCTGSTQASYVAAEWLNVFLRLRNCLPSCRPLRTDTYPTNIIIQWRDE